MTTLTEDYYNTIAFELSNEDDFYYNGSLLVDIDSDQKTFIDQDVDNVIQYSNLGNSDRKSTRLNSSHVSESRMPSSA